MVWFYFQGNGDRYCQFKVEKYRERGFVTLESVASRKHFIGMTDDGIIKPTVDTGADNVRFYPEVIECKYLSWCISVYPMLRVDSRFWLVNNLEIWRRISRLTSSTWDIKTKERHWWRHNGDSDRPPLSLPLRYDLVTLCLCGDLGQINVIAGILKLRKRFRMSQVLFEHGINSLPLVCFRGYENLSTLSIAIPRLAFGRACYCDAACGWIPVSASANKG